jgi:hypothetical protein
MLAPPRRLPSALALEVPAVDLLLLLRALVEEADALCFPFDEDFGAAFFGLLLLLFMSYGIHHMNEGGLFITQHQALRPIGPCSLSTNSGKRWDNDN